jgi:hypothetical protein
LSKSNVSRQTTSEDCCLSDRAEIWKFVNSPSIFIIGHRHMQTRLVEPNVDSLNSADSFLLVTEKYLHVWNGKDSSVMKKSKVMLDLEARFRMFQ